MRNKIIATLCILMFLTGRGMTQDNVIDQIIATVGKNMIMQSDVENQLIQLKSQGYTSSGRDLKCDIFEELLFQKLLLNQAYLDSIEITEREVDYAMDNRFRQIIAKVGSEEALEEYFGKSMLEMKADLKEEMKEQLLIQKMQAKITEGIKITPAEVRLFFKDIPEDSLPTVNTQYEIEQIVKIPQTSDAQKAEVKEKLTKLRDRIVNGESFSTLAVLYSEDPGSATKGGELGFLSREDLVAEFSSVAFNLKTENEVSRIVETEFGLHIIQLIEKRGEMINVRHILMSPKVSPEEIVKAKSSLDSIKKVIKNDSLDFNKAAEKFSDDEETKLSGGLMLNPYTSDSKFEDDYLDPTTKYIIGKIKTGEISDPFETKDMNGKTVYKIIRLKSKISPHKVNLKDDYQKIQEIALAHKKQMTTNDWIKSKQSATYINIDEEYRSCEFQMSGWVK
jgi:peptidyl-prolyl cis-trans isomerase SurA